MDCFSYCYYIVSFSLCILHISSLSNMNFANIASDFNLPLHFLNSVIWRGKILILMKSDISFSSMVYIFVSYSRNLWPLIQVHTWIKYNPFFSMSFIVLALIYKGLCVCFFLIHVKVFLYIFSKCQGLCFCAYISNLVLYHWLQKLFYLYWITQAFLLKINISICLSLSQYHTIFLLQHYSKSWNLIV